MDLPFEVQSQCSHHGLIHIGTLGGRVCVGASWGHPFVTGPAANVAVLYAEVQARPYSQAGHAPSVDKKQRL